MGGTAPDILMTLQITLFAQNIFTYPFNLPKDLENDDGLKFSAPPQDASEFFRPPFATCPKNFDPLLPKN